MKRETAVAIAAQCWCDPETEGVQMDPRLAQAFADRLVKIAGDHMDLLEKAWGIIANASDWDMSTRAEWREKAVEFRTQYGRMVY